MPAPDFLDYEPSRVRFEDVIDHIDRLHELSVTSMPFMRGPPRRRSINSARRRLQRNDGIGMVMLCTLGELHTAWYGCDSPAPRPDPESKEL